MLNKLKKLLPKKKNSFIVEDKIVEEVTADPNFPFLVSFPRTGSHWLRSMMELYFEKPSLKLIFFEDYKNATEYTCYHRHDDDLAIECNNAIYLYRRPAPTIFSQLKFYKTDIHDKDQIIYWSEKYGQHLAKWIFEEKFTTKKTILSYEGLRNNLNQEFAKVCAHFGANLDTEKLDEIAEAVSKSKIKEKTKHDDRVINLSANYDDLREEFKEKYTGLVKEHFYKQHPQLHTLFDK